MYLRKRVGVLAASIIALGVLAGMTAGPTLASPPHCSGDVCAEEVALGGGHVTLHAWARNYAFYGHFLMQTPDHKNLNSHPDKTYLPGGNGPNWTRQDIYGPYCFTAWRKAGPGNHYDNIGYVCFTAG